jgi:HEAT repeat protein
MIYSDFTNKSRELKDSLESFERELPALSIEDKLSLAQNLAESSMNDDYYKLLILFAKEEQEIKNEIYRTISWRFADKKAQFFVDELSNPNRAIVFSIIDLLGVLKERLCVQYLDSLFDPSDVELCLHLLKTLNQIPDPLCIPIIKKGLKTASPEIITASILSLKKWFNEVSWKIFKPLLNHPDASIRKEAAYAIVSRKNKGSAKYILKRIYKEPDRQTRYALIKYYGMIPSNKSLIPLLKLALFDSDQGARLAASRTLDRLQGLLRSEDLFKLRRVRNKKMRAEVLVRMGKFGADKKKYKNYLRKTLLKTKESTLAQACLQALGYIAEHQDIELLANYLGKDPLSSYTSLMGLTRAWGNQKIPPSPDDLQQGLMRGYSATVALTKTWRLVDKAHVLDILKTPLSSTQRQIILKYLLRREGLSLDPVKLLETLKCLLSQDDNMNVQYLSISLLKHAPCYETLSFLDERDTLSTNNFELEAIHMALTAIARQHSFLYLSYMEPLNLKSCLKLVGFIPPRLSIDVYKRLSEIITSKITTPQSETMAHEFCEFLFDDPSKCSGFLRSQSNPACKRFFLENLLKLNNFSLLAKIKDDLIAVMREEDEGIRLLVLDLLSKIKMPDVVPQLIMMAEKSKQPGVAQVVKNIIKDYSQKGVL